MNADVFFDTNVLVYAAVGAGKDEGKRRRALELIDAEDFGTSAQVLQEFFVTVVKKAARPLSPAQAMDWIEQWVAFSLSGDRPSTGADCSRAFRAIHDLVLGRGDSRGCRGVRRPHGLFGGFE